MKIKKIEIWLCELCLNGEGEECHTPGCALFLHSVDLPIAPELYLILDEYEEPPPIDAEPCPHCDDPDCHWLLHGTGC